MFYTNNEFATIGSVKVTLKIADLNVKGQVTSAHGKILV